MRRLDQPSLHVELKRELLRYIRERVEQGETQLPPEAELSEHFGVSRPTLRTAALSLQKEGILTRVHGRGTFVNRRALGLGANISLGQSFLSILRQLGHRAEHRMMAAAEAVLTGDEAAKLELPDPTPGRVITRRFDADGRPAVLAVDHVPLAHLRPDWDGAYRDSVFDFADDACRESIAYSIAEIIPGTAAGDPAQQLELTAGSPLLLLEHVHFTRRDRPLVLTRAFVNPAFIRFYVARTRLEV